MSPAADPRDRSGSTRVLSAREYAFHRFKVRVLRGPDAGKEQIAEGSELGIGTDVGNQLVLTDAAVSRHHCSISAKPRSVLLRDLGSKNGTWLGGYRVEAAFLKPGAVIEVGVSKVQFEPLDEIVREPLSEEPRWGQILGQSSAMRRLFATVARIAPTEATVLLQGETGTGKGLLADAIRGASPRKDGPFVVVDCGSIAPTLVESELFGHEKGAFTGAHAAKPGAFEVAQGGTVLLDEIGELPLDMQPKLLRALEERVIKRVGGLRPIRLDVRVIAATNRDLRKEVNRGSFRADLFYRLNIVTLDIPPLRERREDIPLLVEHFYEQLTGGEGRPPAELVEVLSRREWPGNVRELRNAVERAAVLGSQAAHPSIPPPPAPAAEALAPGAPLFDPALSFRAAKESAVAAWERAYLRELLERNDWNLSRAARAARTDRNHLRELLRRHGIQAEDG